MRSLVVNPNRLLTRERESFPEISRKKGFDHADDALAPTSRERTHWAVIAASPLDKGPKRENAVATLAKASVVNPLVGLFRWG